MKKLCIDAKRARRGRALCAGLVLLWGGLAAGAQTYVVGDSVDDFELVNRKLWFRDNGEAVQPGDPLRLTDFHGKIVFYEWFTYW